MRLTTQLRAGRWSQRRYREKRHKAHWRLWLQGTLTNSATDSQRIPSLFTGFSPEEEEVERTASRKKLFL
jgi:hypothetical protein